MLVARFVLFAGRRPPLSKLSNGWPMCRRSGRGGLPTGELGAVGTIGLLGAPDVAPHLNAAIRHPAQLIEMTSDTIPVLGFDTRTAPHDRTASRRRLSAQHPTHELGPYASQAKSQPDTPKIPSNIHG